MMSDSVLIDVRSAEPLGSVALILLSQAAEDELLSRIDTLLLATSGYDSQLLNLALSAIESRGLTGTAALEPYLEGESPWRNTALGKWLIARLLEQKGQPDRAVEAWNRVISSGVGPVHEALLSRSRSHKRAGNIRKALADLRRAAMGSHDYAHLARAAKLLTRLRRVVEPPATRRTRVALLSSTTTDLSAPLLQLACFRDGIDAELYVGPFGGFRQDILNPQSALYRFRPDFVLMATNWRDANLPPFSDTPEADVQSVLDEFQQLWKVLLQRHACRVIQHNFDLPTLDSYGHLSCSMNGGRAYMLRETNRRLLDVAPPAVTVLDLDQVSSRFGKDAWYDASYWHLAKQYPAADALPLLVDHQVALMSAALGLTKKVLVLDLDNTLWGGVIGEDGLEGIRLGPPSPAGEAHQALQQYAAELKDRGVLLAVCSKNNDADARQPFLHHDAMILSLEDLGMFLANWSDKPANLRRMAGELNLGIDSFVFLDDNPVERALVRRELPDVAVPEIGEDPALFVATLDRGLFFESLTLSQEDRERHRIYRANTSRSEARDSAGSLEGFLQGLDMEAEAGPFNELVLARVVQLIGKTNQFNLTARRHSQAAIRRMIESDQYWTQYFKLKDRFGDNGLVGVMIARRVDADSATWEVDTWLMSCRVIGRQMEQLMFQTVAEAAVAGGVHSVRGVYNPTAKNALVSDLYPRLGFSKLRETSDGVDLYSFDLSSGNVPQCEFIRLVSV